MWLWHREAKEAWSCLLEPVWKQQLGMTMADLKREG